MLWKPMGYYKSMLLTVRIGLVGAVLMAMVGLATLGSLMGGLLLLLIAAMCFVDCLRLHRLLLSEGPWGFSEEDPNIFAAASYDRRYAGQFDASSSRDTADKESRCDVSCVSVACCAVLSVVAPAASLPIWLSNAA